MVKQRGGRGGRGAYRILPEVFVCFGFRLPSLSILLLNERIWGAWGILGGEAKGGEEEGAFEILPEVLSFPSFV